MSEIAIACDGISKQFDGVPVLKGIYAKFHFAAVTVLAGENGAGKSTLFKIIAGQLAPGRGPTSTLRRNGYSFFFPASHCRFSR
jgi:ABC-type sugar transport system ATPase subunit